jgi:Flp pilus assembly protein TadD
VNAHLTLANLYANRLGESAKARAHYRKVLELEPKHPESVAIRYWLAANPG